MCRLNIKELIQGKYPHMKVDAAKVELEKKA